MGISSINTNIAAQYAQQNISLASSLAQSSVARLSSGNRIVQASGDVAGLTIGTSLQSQVSALNTALVNASQATSLLQVADGALAQIQSILQQQKSIALQAGSGSLTDIDRGFLNQQFQALSDQINNLTATTTFNSVGLLDGSLSQTVGVGTSTNAATASTIQVNFAATVATGTTFIVNGVTLTIADSPSGAGNIQRGTSTEATVQNIADYLNNAQNDTSGNALSAANKLLVSSAKYEANGSVLTVTARAGGSNFSFIVEDSNSAGSTTTVYNVVGNGSNTVSTVSGINATSLDADIVDSGTADFTLGALTFDGVTVATLTADDTLRTIVAKINDSSNSTGVTAYVTGSTGDYTLNLRYSSDDKTGTVAGAALNGLTTAAAGIADGTEVLAGGQNDGLGYGSVTATGSTGGATSILTDQSQTAAIAGYNFNSIADGNLVDTLDSLNFVLAGVTFTFTTTDFNATSLTEIAIGDTLEETLDNAVAKINSYVADTDSNYQFNQFTASRDGTRLVFTANTADGVQDVGGTDTTVALGTLGSNATVFGSFADPTNTGVDTKGIVNPAFVGSISGVTATYSDTNEVDLSVTIGGIQYLAKGIDTNPTADTEVRFVSETGGFFSIELRGGNGDLVTNQSGANTFAERINSALSGLTFSQNRVVTSYDAGTGALRGSSVSYNSTDFDNLKINDISVIAPSGSNTNGSVIFSINGEAYTSTVPLGGQIGANATVKFVSASDPDKFLTFQNGANFLDLSSASAASALQSELRSAFGVGEGSEALSFQVGTTAASTVKVSIENASTSNIFGGQTLSVATAPDAANAAAVLDQAIASVTSIRANVGALQTQFNFASAALQSGVQNQDAARSQFLDTDIAAESTAYATSQVKLQAGISVLAQANQQLQALLKLIG